MFRVKLTVNGEERIADVPDPAIPLLFVLRDFFDLKGTKLGCAEGVCGACTVLVDGAAVRSCQTAVADLGSAAVITIEGLSEHGTHPIQRAFAEADVPQCGYCQSGQIMRAAAFLTERPEPTRREVEDAMAEILCRCGTGPRIAEAVLRAAKLIRR